MARRNLKRLSTEELQAEIERRQRQLPALMDQRRRLVTELNAVERQIDALGGQLSGRGRGRNTAARRGGPRRRPKNEKSLADMIASVLPKDKPMKVSDIADQVTARGYQSNAANFSTIVNQALIKDKRFEAVSRGYYAFAQNSA